MRQAVESVSQTALFKTTNPSVVVKDDGYEGQTDCSYGSRLDNAGNNVNEFSEALFAGRSGIGPLDALQMRTPFPERSSS